MRSNTWNLRSINLVSLAALALLAGAVRLHAQPSLQITSPADGTVVSPGQSVTVTVSASGTFLLVALVGEDPLGFSQGLSAPPYNFTLTIPSNIPPDKYAVTAAGAYAQGESVTSLPILLVVEPTTIPQSYRTEPETLTNLWVGVKAHLRVIGRFADGSTANVTYSTRTTYSTSDPGVATVDSSGVVTAVAPGNATILVNRIAGVPVSVLQPVAVVPRFAKLHGGQSQEFVSQVRMEGDKSVTWSLTPAVGSVSGEGVYTAPPSIASTQQIAIRATSVADNTRSATATITLYRPAAVTVSPSTAALRAGQPRQFTATVGNAVNAPVTWSVTPVVGTMNATGLYTAPATIATTQTVAVTATSVTDPTKSASATVMLRKSN